jgi:spermidine synthase
VGKKQGALWGQAAQDAPVVAEPRNPFIVSLFLFGSGFAGLVYQMVWLREMRLVFGVSTAASAAVLAIFMGGLGLGGALLGRRADRSANPLKFYSSLEFGAALCAFLSPYLLDLTRTIYVGLGGSTAMGMPMATLARLVLSSLVLGVPTILMGGALPAAARAVESDADSGRRRLALLYGVNTLGGVVGALLATFAFLELLGARDTLLVACCVNALAAILARNYSRGKGVVQRDAVPPPLAVSPPRDKPPRLYVYASAAVVGFAFFIMELVWYRMLGPLLGGSTYTFGLILGVALLGIGLGGGLYAMRAHGKPATTLGFGLTCGLEALCIAFPYALGDRLAIFTALIQPLGGMGMAGAALGWTIVTVITIFPAALIAGYQFPLLINLLGDGVGEVGEHTGRAYAWNTVGAILGSLAGGFLLLPALTSLGVWKCVACGLGLLGASAAVLAVRKESWPKIGGVSLVIVVAWALMLAEGPTAAWRHSPIGAGRVDLSKSDINGIRRWRLDTRREILWEAEGLESSVAISGADGFSFLVNGKADGNIIGDASTQVMLGLVGAILHPRPRTAMVIGLGTGSTAGWLAEAPGMERVDVAELEPAIMEVARRCAPANFNALQNPKLKIHLGDARELLLTSRARYDLIVSEPSNPYRAGIASLFTREYYLAAAERLTSGGIFSQWLQGYEVDTDTVLTVCATLRSVFPYVQIWRTLNSDMIFLCSKEKITYEVDSLRRKIQSHPYQEALLRIWGGGDLETFFAHHIANESFTRALTENGRYPIPLSTDDSMNVEFGFARSVGKGKKFFLGDVARTARARGEALPEKIASTIDLARWSRQLVLSYPPDEELMKTQAQGSAQFSHIVNAYKAYQKNDYNAVRDAWKKQPWPLFYPGEYAAIAWALADSGDPEALILKERLTAFWPGEGNVIEAQYLLKKGDYQGAFSLVTKTVELLQTDPWVQSVYLTRTINQIEHLSNARKDLAPASIELLAKPFVVNAKDSSRRLTMIKMAIKSDCARASAAMRMQEPFPFWDLYILNARQLCYRETNSPYAEIALDEYRDFIYEEPRSFTLDLFSNGPESYQAP